MTYLLRRQDSNLGSWIQSPLPYRLATPQWVNNVSPDLSDESQASTIQNQTNRPTSLSFDISLNAFQNAGFFIQSDQSHRGLVRQAQAPRTYDGAAAGHPISAPSEEEQEWK